MLAIKNNIMAGNAARHLGKAYDGLATSVERLASGLRINSAKDDAAGLAVRELIRADIAVLQQGSRNASDGISMLQTMEGAMAVIDDNLIRMKELAEQAATGSYSDAQRTIMNAEFAEMADEIERIAGATKFNDISMLDDTGADATVDIHVGTTDVITITKTDMTKTGLGINTGAGGVTVQSDTSNGVDATGDSWLTIDDTAVGSWTLAIGFTSATASLNETSFSVVFSTSSNADTYSLQNIVDKINLSSQNRGLDENGATLNYAAASAVLDSGSGKYVLKLASQKTTSNAVTMTGVGLSTSGTISGGWSGGDAWTTPESIETASYFNAVVTSAGVNIMSIGAATAALNTITTAINTKDTARAAFGYKMNRLESTIAILDIQSENLQAAESRISDVDVATEMATLTRTQVLSQAGISMLAQANQMPQMALSLLR